MLQTERKHIVFNWWWTVNANLYSSYAIRAVIKDKEKVCKQKDQK